ncbi:MAG: phage tail tape measure protein [Paracoccaceae bacterium]
MADLDIQLVMRLVDQVSGPARDAERALGRIEDRAGRSRGAMMGAVAGVARAGAIAATAGVAAAGAAGAAAVASAISMEDAWSDANKTLELTPQQLDLLREGVDDLAAELPVARMGLVEILGTAGQLGIRGREDLLAFTSDAAKMSATFDISAAASAGMMGKWREQMGYTQEETRFLADQINYLGNTTAANSADMAAYTTEVLKIGTDAGLSEELILALGASMIASGRAPEVAATGLRAFMRTMTEVEEDLSETERSVIERIGLAGQWGDIQTQFYDDAPTAIRRVVEAIETLPEADQASAIGKLFGEEAGRAIGGLLGDTEALEQALARITELEGAEGSMLSEFDALSNDVADNWQRVMNVIGGQSGGIGRLALEPINDALLGTLDILTTLDQRATVLDRVGAAWSGFVNGLDVPAGASDRIDAMRESLHAFLFGVVEEDGGDELGRIFVDAQELGRRARTLASEVGASAAAIAAGAGEIVEGGWPAAGDAVREAFDTLASLRVPELDLTSLLPEDLPGLALLVQVEDGINDVLTSIQDVRAAVLEAGGNLLDGLMSGDADQVAASVEGLFERLRAIELPAFDLTGMIPEDMPGAEMLTALATALEGIGSAVANFVDLGLVSIQTMLGGWFDGAAPYLDGLRESFGEAWSAVSELLTEVGGFYSDLAAGLGDLAGSEGGLSVLRQFGSIMGSLAAQMATVALDGITGAVRLLTGAIEMIRGVMGGDWDAAFAPIRDLFDWIANLDVGGLLPDLDPGAIVATIAGWFAFDWSEVLPEWDWGAIIPDMPDLATFFGGGEDTLFDRLRDANGDGIFDLDWDEGNRIIDDLEGGAISLQQAIDALTEARISGSANAQEEADRILQALTTARELAMQIEVPEPDVPTVKSLVADRAQIDAVRDRLAETSAIAAALPAEVASAAAAAEAAAVIDLTSAGIAAAQTFADGIVARTPAAVQAARVMAQAVAVASRVPGAPQAAANAAPAVAGARALGGGVTAGQVYRIGEQGEELFLPGVSGQVVSHSVLRRMANPRVEPAGSVPIPAARGGGSGSVTIGDVHIHVPPGAQDPRAIAMEVRRELARMTRHPRNTALHDGGDHAV